MLLRSLRKSTPNFYHNDKANRRKEVSTAIEAFADGERHLLRRHFLTLQDSAPEYDADYRTGTRMRKVIKAGIVLLFCVAVAQAQGTPVTEIAVGYSNIQVKSSDLTASGGSSSVAFNVNKWLGAVGDFGLYRSSVVGSGLAAGTYAFGPRVSYRHWGVITPFAQVVFGGLRYANNGLTFGCGGGVDIAASSEARFALRPQVDYVRFRANGNWINTIRIGLGVVFRIRKRS